MKKDEIILHSIRQRVKLATDSAEIESDPGVALNLMNVTILHIAEVKKHLHHARDTV